MKLTKKQIEGELKDLRENLIDGDATHLEQRLAYMCECAVRYVTEDTTDWENLQEAVINTAALIYSEMR